MKSFAVLAACLVLASIAAADDMHPMMVGSAYGGAAAAPAASYGGGGSSYGSSIPAPPCPKNYLFSCQPSLSPAPCSQPAPSYGSAGAYSDNYPVYALPVPQQYNYNGYQTY